MILLDAPADGQRHGAGLGESLPDVAEPARMPAYLAEREAHRRGVYAIPSRPGDWISVCRCGWTSGPLTDHGLALVAECPRFLADSERLVNLRRYGALVAEVVRHG